MIHTIVIRGDRALFARPDCTDPISYPFITPSAVRGVVERVYWHPGLYVDVREIAVLRPIQWDREGIVEVRSSLQAHEKGKAVPEYKRGIFTAPVPFRRVTTCVVLREPAWRVQFRLRLKPGEIHNTPLEKADKILARRLASGELHSPPYLGVARYGAIVGPPTGDERPVAVSRDFGFVLHDMDYRATPPIQHVFHARMFAGVIEVPSFHDLVLSKKEAA